MSSITRDGDGKPAQPETENDSGFSRRSFLKGSGLALSVPLVAGRRAHGQSGGTRRQNSRPQQSFDHPRHQRQNTVCNIT